MFMFFQILPETTEEEKIKILTGNQMKFIQDCWSSNVNVLPRVVSLGQNLSQTDNYVILTEDVFYKVKNLMAGVELAYKIISCLPKTKMYGKFIPHVWITIQCLVFKDYENFSSFAAITEFIDNLKKYGFKFNYQREN